MAGGQPNPGQEYVSLVERGIIRMPPGATPVDRSRNDRGPGKASGAKGAGPRPQAPGGRHCWVLADDGARMPGLLTQWRQEQPAGRRGGGGWVALVAYAAEVDGETILIQAWISADRLQPADTR